MQEGRGPLSGFRVAHRIRSLTMEKGFTIQGDLLALSVKEAD
jgi:hypothetical protein